MKKIFFVLFVCAMLIFPIDRARAVDGTVFAKNSTISQAYVTLTADATRAQTFTAAVDNFTGFYAYLNDRVNGSAIVAYLINESSKEVIETSSQRMGSGSGWEEFNFNSPLSKESVYRVKILVPTASGVKWVYSNNTYDGGMRYYGENTYDESTDMSFQAWGYDNPADEGTNTGDQTATATATTATETATGSSVAISAVASETPAASVSTSIAKPTELKASQEKGVTLSWKASTTTNIDGYKIFRSETKGKGYNKIGQVAKTLTTYSDQTVEKGKTYYYVVRAYKGTGQSESSNEANITIADNGENSEALSGAESVPGGEYVASTNNYLLWSLGIAALVLTLILLILIKRRQDKAKRGKPTSQPQKS